MGSTDQLENLVKAKRFVRGIGPIPPSFSTAIRGLITDLRSGQKTISSANEFQVKRLLTAPTVLASLYYATQSIYPDKIKTENIITPLDLARNYSPDTLAAILLITYLGKRVERLCSMEEWGPTRDALHKHSNVCIHLGMRYPKVGMMASLLGSILPYLSLGILLSHDRKGVPDYRRQLKIKKLFLESEVELERWGCTVIDLSADLLLGGGFDSELVKSFYDGMNGATDTDEKLKFKLVKFWLDYLAADGRPPGLKGKDLPNELNEMLSALNSQMSEFEKIGDQRSWITRGRADIGADETPNLDLTDVVFPT